MISALPIIKQIEIYQGEDGQTQIQVRLEKDTIWLSQAQMAELFDKYSDTICTIESKAAHLLYFVVKNHTISK